MRPQSNNVRCQNVPAACARIASDAASNPHLFRSTHRGLFHLGSISTAMSFFKHTVIYSLVAAATYASPGVTPNDDQPQIEVEFDPLAVFGVDGASLTAPSLEAARLRLALTPGGVEVIDAGRFLRGRASTVEDTFALSPGVIAQSRFGSDEARLSIRGSGIQRTYHGRGIRVLQDGVPINLADGSFDMQALEPLSATCIKIWRGGNALAHGGSTLGGAIEYVSRTGRNAPPLFSRVEVGSWDYIRTSLAAGGTRDRMDGYASFTHQSQSGFRDHARQSNQRLFANGALRHSDNVETRVYLTAVKSVSELPGSLSLAGLRENPRAASPGSVALDYHRDFELMRLASTTAVRTGHTVWDFTLAWTYKDLDHPIFQVIDQLSNDGLAGLTATRIGTIAGRNHRIRGGVFFTRGVIEAANFENLAGERGELISRADQTATNLEAFFEDQIELSHDFTLVLGVAAFANRREKESIVGGAPGYAVDYSRVMPKVGLRWDGNGARIFANVSSSYEPPSFAETLTLNTARDAQAATTVEVGTRGTRGPLRWDIALYHARIENELLAIDHDNDPSTPSATVNADRTTHSGIELGVEIDLLGSDLDGPAPGQRLVLRGAWTHGRFRFNDDPRYGDNTLAGLPEHLIRGELTWEHRSGWYAGPTIEWVPVGIFIDHRNTFASSDYAIYGFRVGRRRASGISWFLEARNLGDRTYVATTGVIENARGGDQAQFLPGDERGFFTGVEYRW